MGTKSRGRVGGRGAGSAAMALAGTLWAAACGSSASKHPGTKPPDTGVPPPVVTGSDGGVTTPPPDAGITFGGPGPWPLTNVTYGSADGILEPDIVGTSTDETQNLWVATHEALYLLQPGQARFRRFDSAAGLHLMDNPVRYCDTFGDMTCPIYGAAFAPGISEIAGGGPDEVFVGYYGNEDPTYAQDWTDPNRHTGKMDRVRLKADGTLQVDRFDFVFTSSAQFWHDRTVERLLFDHFVHPHDLYVGTNHGVDWLRPDRFRAPGPNEWFIDVTKEYMSDHLHPRVCYHAVCTGTERDDQRMGDWRGLALQPDGQIWVAGRWTGGLIRYDTQVDPGGKPDLEHWEARPGGQAFSNAFGDPYCTAPAVASGRAGCGGGVTPDGSGTQPVFRPADEGEPVDLSAVAVTPDGRAWFASGPYYSNPNDIAFGVAAWDGRSFTRYDPVNDLGMSEENVRDLLALPDGRLVLAGPHSGLVLYNPADGTHVVITAGQGIPSNDVNRLELDTMVNPPALHVSTYGGAAVLRTLPAH